MRLVSLRHLTILLVSISLTGCMLGPDFHSPPAPATNKFTEDPQPKPTIRTKSLGAAGKSQEFTVGADIPAEWWKLFHSEALNKLIVQGIANNPTLAAAQSTLREAQETLNAQIGSNLFPKVTASLGGERQLFNASLFGTPGTDLFNLYNATVNVTYTIDIWGAARRQVESVTAQAEYEAFELEAAYLTLTSNIVTTAVTIASLRAQIDATNNIIKAEANSLRITKVQFKYGGVPGLSVLSQQSQLSLTQATLGPLEQSLAQAQHSMSVLIGALPSEDQIPKFDLNKITLPADLPLSLPSLLVRQRPDVRASEALLHSACAQVGVATANLLPQFTLSGAYGWQALVPSALFSKTTNTWNWGGTLLQPIFEGGALLATRRAEIAAYNVAASQYKQTVLTAFQNVADSLRALQHDAQTLRDYRASEIAALKAWKITQLQYNEGGVSYLSLITAENQYQQSIISRVQAQAARYSDTAALFQALGGGWWNYSGPPRLMREEKMHELA
jgi:NodT family efflux transporter outer membrane factor (OMF) lipoprotein